MQPKQKRSKRRRRPARELENLRTWELPNLDVLLASRTTEYLNFGYLPEPQLYFGGKQKCEDPKTGLAAFGPYSKSDITRRTQIRVGIVGPAEAIDRAITLLEQMSSRIEQSAKTDAVLHPSFPGMNADEPFQVEFVTQRVWQRPLKQVDIAMVEGNPDFTERIGLLLAAVRSEVRALKVLDPGPDVVLCVMSESLERLCRVGIGEYDRTHEDETETPDEDIAELLNNAVEVEEPDAGGDEDDFEIARSFRRGLKAECLDLIPTQLIWHRTLAGSRGVQDLPTRAWNLSVALMYKAQIIPWRLVDVIEGSCFIGVSFFHDDEARSKTLRTSIAQAFTERGEGFVLQGDSFEWDSRKEGEPAPHLKREDAKKLLAKVLSAYEAQVLVPPRKVVLHKSSRFSDEERAGFEDALRTSNITQYALVTINRRGMFTLRPGKRAVLRGTVVDFGQKLGLIYTTGYIPFLHCYPGFRIPQPIEITENWGSLGFREVAEDILRLTKLNWNTAAFNCHDPITLAFSKKVGDILKMAKGKEPAIHYRYYM
jgi:hypothetical protein